jgi:mono/diheme cytochrome c family protein
MTSMSDAAISTVANTSAASASGQQLYDANCTACHGADGKGALRGLPDFTAKNGRMNKSDAELFRNIIHGFQTRGSVMPMPPRGGNSALSDADILAVLEYIRATFAP